MSTTRVLSLKTPTVFSQETHNLKSSAYYKVKELVNWLNFISISLNNYYMSQRQVSDKELLQDLGRVAAGHEGKLTVQDYRDEGEYSHTLIQRRFGTWNNAKEEAGLETTEAIQSDKVTKSDLVEDIKRVSEKIDGKITKQKYKEEGRYSFNTVEYKFSGFEEAFEKAGVRHHAEEYSRKNVLKDVTTVIDNHGPKVKLEDYQKHGYYPSWNIYNHFGSFGKAVRAVEQETDVRTQISVSKEKLPSEWQEFYLSYIYNIIDDENNFEAIAAGLYKLFSKDTYEETSEIFDVSEGTSWRWMEKIRETFIQSMVDNPESLAYVLNNAPDKVY